MTSWLSRTITNTGGAAGLRGLRNSATAALGVVRPRGRRRVLAEARARAARRAAAAGRALEACGHILAPTGHRLRRQLLRDRPLRRQECILRARSLAIRRCRLRGIAAAALGVVRPRDRRRVLAKTRARAARRAA